MLLVPSRKDAKWTSWLLCFKSLLRRSWAEIDYRCALLFNNSGELCRLDDFAPFGECDMNNISLLPCLNNGICDFQKENDRDSSSTSGCWEGVNLPRKDKMGCGWCCKNQTVDLWDQTVTACAWSHLLNRNTPPSPGWSSLKGYHPSCIATYEELLPTTDLYVIFWVIVFSQPASS